VVNIEKYEKLLIKFELDAKKKFDAMTNPDDLVTEMVNVIF
jgi:hypothetical protein